MASSADSYYGLFPFVGSDRDRPAAPGATVWGDAVNGFEMSLFFDPQRTGTKPQLRVGLRNVGSSAIELTLGSSCGAGKPEPNMITLVLTDDQGKS
jgi:hypothetical protein